MADTLWARLRNGLSRTRSRLTDRIRSALTGRSIDDDALDALEEILVGADVGIEATTKILDSVREDPKRRAGDAEWVIGAVRSQIERILAGPAVKRLNADRTPTVILVVGVNGAGKTTTVGKLAARFAAAGKRVLIGAADTFRAAADEQLVVWAKRANAEIVKQQRGADAASVAFDAVSAARSREADVVLIDTAGRLHTKTNLMDELRKIRRVLAKVDPAYPHETLLVLDATSGQNALVQARQFNDAVGITGVALTKLDSSARGGIAVAVADELGLPITLIGVGEALEDLQDFDSEAFVAALFGEEA